MSVLVSYGGWIFFFGAGNLLSCGSELRGMNPPVANRARWSAAVESSGEDFSLAGARRGDTAACRALVLRHQCLVFAILSRLLAPAGRLDRLEDLAQETFLRVFRSLDRFSAAGPARLSTWIGTIASRVAIDELRRPRPQRSESPAAADALAVAQSTEDARLRRLRRCLNEALASLAPEARALFVLRAYEGWSHRELAEAFGVPPGTIKSRLGRTRAKLRRTLDELLEVADET